MERYPNYVVDIKQDNSLGVGHLLYDVLIAFERAIHLSV